MRKKTETGAVTLKQIAKDLNLSVMTVSYALNGQKGVSEETRQRVLQAGRARGYHPNLAARSLLTGKTNLISLWMSYPHTAYYGRMLYHLKQEIKQDNYEAIISDAHETEEAAQITRWPVDGIIACQNPQALSNLHRNTPSPRPSVYVGPFSISLFPNEMDYSIVEEASGVSEAIEHLVGIGCRRIVLLSAPHWEKSGNPRSALYEQIMRKHNLPIEIIQAQDFTRMSGRVTMREYIQQNGCPDGLFCNNDDLAIGAYLALRDLGIRIPDDISLIGCDGIEETEYLDVPISTIIHPIRQMCATAWQFLQQRIQEPGLPQQTAQFSAHLELRASTRKD